MSTREKFFVAVTGCPTGIAHTFMAEAALKKAAEKAGAGIRVETNGAVGIENALTAEEIARADMVILASDKAVEMARFDGKPLIRASVGHGVKKATELVARAMAGEEDVYRNEQPVTPDHEKPAAEKAERQGAGRSVYIIPDERRVEHVAVCGRRGRVNRHFLLLGHLLIRPDQRAI